MLMALAFPMIRIELDEDQSSAKQDINNRRL